MNRVIIRGLLGAAAGIAMVSGAQAADMPVKAKPVEYVKICSAYGAGFYYIPGTDICLRVGGYVYAEWGVKGNDATAGIYSSVNNNHRIDAEYNYSGMRTSARIILDARQNTAYGTLRAYLVAGTSKSNGGTNAAGLDAAFIQFAGFTWGFTDTFFSFARPGYGIVANLGTDWLWTQVFAYTAQLGNGVTASVSLEEPVSRRTAIIGAPAGVTYGGRWMPDVVGNINVTQAWGRAQIMGAVHQVKGNDTAAGLGVGDEWGWAVGAGIEVKTPQTGNANNSVILQGAYTEGAVSYTGFDGGAGGGGGAVFAVPNWAGTGPLYAVHDAYVAGAGSINLTEAWSVYAAYRHYWTPMLRTSFGVGYVEIDGAGHANAANPGDLDALQVNISTVWSPVAGLDLSLDLVYSDVDQSNIGGVAGANASNDILTAWTRIRRNF